MKMDYKPFYGKKITYIGENHDWVTIYCGKDSMSFRLISLEEEKILRSVRSLTDEEILRRKQSGL